MALEIPVVFLSESWRGCQASHCLESARLPHKSLESAISHTEGRGAAMAGKPEP